MIDNYMGPLAEVEYRERQRNGAIGGSGLAIIHKLSVAHYLANARRMSERGTGDFGTMVHALVLEPGEFGKRYRLRGEPIKLDTPEPRKVERPEVSRLDGDDGWTVLHDNYTWESGDPMPFDTKALATQAAKEVSGWTFDGETFHATKKAALEAEGGALPWAIAGDEDGPRYRTRDDALAALDNADERIAVKAGDMERAELMRAAINAHRVAHALLAHADCEHAVLWHDKAAGVDCSGKIDAIAVAPAQWARDVLGATWLQGDGDVRIGIDLKTRGRDTPPSSAGYAVGDGGWHLQGAHYMAGAEANGRPLDLWVTITVETQEPYGVVVAVLHPDYLMLGRYLRHKALLRARDYVAGGWADGYDPAPVVAMPRPGADLDDAAAAEFDGWLANDRAERVAAAQLRVDEAKSRAKRFAAVAAERRDGLAGLADKAAALARTGDMRGALEAVDLIRMSRDAIDIAEADLVRADAEVVDALAALGAI